MDQISFDESLEEKTFDELMALRRQALARQDSFLYTFLTNYLGVVNDVEDPYLYQGSLEHPPMNDSNLGVLGQQRRGKTSFQKKKLPSLRGFSSLSLFPYDALETMFYGMHNLPLPKTMVNQMNLNEILAQWYAIGKIKRLKMQNDEWEKTYTSLAKKENLDPNQFLDVVRLLERIAYHDPHFAKVAHQLPQRYERKKGDLLQALGTLDQATQQAFMDAFKKPYLPSSRESEAGTFYDPNVDGRNKQLYIKYLKDFFQ